MPLIRVRIEIEVEEPQALPRYLFSPLRGMIGAALKRISCVARSFESCSPCPLNQHCAYGYIFETPRPQEADRLRLYPYLPHPFAIAPPFPPPESKSLSVGLVLVGRAIQYFPHLILAFEAIGKRGLGRKRVPFRILHIHDEFTGEELYRNGNLSPPALKKDFPPETAREVIFTTRTPLTLRYKGQIVTPQNFSFHVLIRNLLRRLSALSYFHASRELTVDFKAFIARAEEVRILSQNLETISFNRYSARRKQSMPLKGLWGRVVFSGVLDEFIPFLRLGEQVQVGKNTAFGFGAYQLDFS